MGERPILFSAPMVRAILAGRKTQTRRIFKGVEPMGDGTWHVFGGGGGTVLVHTADIPAVAVDYVRFAVGDVLWVRETFAARLGEDGSPDPNPRYVKYRADPYHGKTPSHEMDWHSWPAKWSSPIHMPRWASRITLNVTGVKVERLQDISRDDVIAEGITERDGVPIAECVAGWHEPYASLWNTINGPGSWEANPWVVAISFERAPEVQR